MKTAMQKKQSGQGVVELVLCLFGFFTVLFMYFQVAMGFAAANYIQYATFMAARALQAGHLSPDDQKKAAASVMARMVGETTSRYPGMFKPSGEGDSSGIAGATIGPTNRVKLKQATSRSTAWEQGVTYKFKLKMYMLPLVSTLKSKSGDFLELQSESWLGRDPSQEDCLQILEERRKKSLPKIGAFLYDNGC